MAAEREAGLFEPSARKSNTSPIERRMCASFWAWIIRLPPIGSSTVLESNRGCLDFVGACILRPDKPASERNEDAASLASDNESATGSRSGSRHSWRHGPAISGRLRFSIGHSAGREPLQRPGVHRHVAPNPLRGIVDPLGGTSLEASSSSSAMTRPSFAGPVGPSDCAEP